METLFVISDSRRGVWSFTNMTAESILATLASIGVADARFVDQVTAETYMRSNRPA